MTTGLLIMTKKELDRIGVITNVIEKRIKQSDAMKVLGLSKRQVIRLVKSGQKLSLRSSIWKYQHHQWQMIFHQGTPCHGKSHE